MKTFTDKEATSLREKAVTQAEAVTKSVLDLAETLFDIYHSKVMVAGKDVPVVVAWRFEDFHEYVETELHMHGSTAERYVKVYDKLILTQGAEPDKLPKSITKLIQLMRLASAGRSVKGWLKRSHDYTACEFEHAVDEELGETGRKSCRKIFTFTGSQMNAVEKEIRKAKDLFGTTTNGETLSRIVKEWSEIKNSVKLRRVG